MRQSKAGWPGSLDSLCYKVNCRQAREGALGYKVNCRQARQGESPPGERRSSGGEGALGYKVNRRQARQGELRSKRGSSGGEGALGYHARYDCLNPTDFQDQIMDIREVER